MLRPYDHCTAEAPLMSHSQSIFVENGIILTLKKRFYLFKRIIIIVITLNKLSPIKRSRILEAKSGRKKSKPHIVER